MGLFSEIFSEIKGVINEEIQSSGIIDDLKGELRKSVRGILFGNSRDENVEGKPEENVDESRMLKDDTIPQEDSPQELNNKIIRFIKWVKLDTGGYDDYFAESIKGFLKYIKIGNLSEELKGRFNKYFNIPSDETILVVFDSTLTGNCSEGLVLTTERIMFKSLIGGEWKLPLKKYYLCNPYENFISINDGETDYTFNNEIHFGFENENLYIFLSNLIYHALEVFGTEGPDDNATKYIYRDEDEEDEDDVDEEDEEEDEEYDGDDEDEDEYEEEDNEDEENDGFINDNESIRGKINLSPNNYFYKMSIKEYNNELAIMSFVLFNRHVYAKWLIHYFISKHLMNLIEKGKDNIINIPIYNFRRDLYYGDKVFVKNSNNSNKIYEDEGFRISMEVANTRIFQSFGINYISSSIEKKEDDSGQIEYYNLKINIKADKMNRKEADIIWLIVPSLSEVFSSTEGGDKIFREVINTSVNTMLPSIIREDLIAQKYDIEKIDSLINLYVIYNFNLFVKVFIKELLKMNGDEEYQDSILSGEEPFILNIKNFREKLYMSRKIFKSEEMIPESAKDDEDFDYYQDGSMPLVFYCSNIKILKILGYEYKGSIIKDNIFTVVAKCFPLSVFDNVE
jgi:hypothetical protein